MAGKEAYAEVVAERVAGIRQRIAEAARRAGRDPASVELLAVTKFHPIEAALAAYASGVRRFGENRIQEAEAKYASFPSSCPEARLDLLGHLQGNKVGKALRLFSRIHSVDSANLLESLLSRSPDLEGAVEFLFELNTAEATKSGFSSSAALFEACE